MITLTKEDGPADLDGVTHLSIGVSWDPTAAPAAECSASCAARPVRTSTSSP